MSDPERLRLALIEATRQRWAAAGRLADAVSDPHSRSSAVIACQRDYQTWTDRETEARRLLARQSPLM